MYKGYDVCSCNDWNVSVVFCTSDLHNAYNIYSNVQVKNMR